MTTSNRIVSRQLGLRRARRLGVFLCTPLALLCPAQEGIGPPPSVEQLKAKFQSETGKEAFERIATIEAFGRIRSTESAEFLAGLFALETNGGVGAAVTRTLGRIGTEAAVKALIQKGMPYFLEPQGVGPGAKDNALREDRRALLDSMEVALLNELEPRAEEWLVGNGLTPFVRKHERATGIVVKAIAGLRTRTRFPLLLSEISKLAYPSAQIAILEALREGTEKSDKFASAALQLIKASNQGVQTAAYDLLASLPGGKHRGPLISGLKHQNWAIRVICLDGLSHLGDKEIVKHAVHALQDPDLKVRLAAIEALFEQGGPEVIEPLFTALDKADGRTRDDITDSLTRLTGKNFGPMATQWESWWAQAKNTYKKTTPLTPDELALLKAQDAKKFTLAIPLYFGLRILSKRTAFLMDCSESMNEEFVPQNVPTNRGKTVVVKKPEPNEGASAGGGPSRARPGARRKQEGAVSRLDEAKREMLGMLSKLPEDQSLNLFRFNSLITDFIAVTFPERQARGGVENKMLARLDARVRAAAGAFVTNSRAEGQTNLFSALREALEYGDLDTIYLLSDGAPTMGITNHEQFLREVRRINRLRRVKINSISFHPLPAERALLRSLAVENHGVYVEP